MAIKDAKEKETSWWRPDLAYEHLHLLKLEVTKNSMKLDLKGWYNALESEYRLVWGHIEAKAKLKGMGREYFEERWRSIRDKLFDYRYNNNSPTVERLKSLNFGHVRSTLHQLNMDINELEIDANLNITRDFVKDQGFDGVRNKYHLEADIHGDS